MYLSRQLHLLRDLDAAFCSVALRGRSTCVRTCHGRFASIYVIVFCVCWLFRDAEKSTQVRVVSFASAGLFYFYWLVCPLSMSVRVVLLFFLFCLLLFCFSFLYFIWFVLYYAPFIFLTPQVESRCVADSMWYFPLLEPWVDHVPVKADLSDLEEKIRLKSR